MEWPVGRTLHALHEAGRTTDAITVQAGGEITRVDPFLAGPLDCAVAPHAYAFASPGFRSYATPDCVAYRFDQVTILGSDGVVVSEGEVVADTVAHLMDWAEGSMVVASSSTVLRLRQALPVREQDGQAFLVGFSGAWRNYAHWMQECLPKLFAFQRLCAHVPGLMLVVPPFEPGSFHERTLELLGIGVGVQVVAGHGQALVLRQAWVMTHADIWSVPRVVQAAAAALGVAALQRVAGGASGGERVYIHRATENRRVANYQAIAALVQRHGFRIVAFEGMPLADQIATMHTARWVIAEHGAGLANILFCQPGASVLELFSPATPQPEFWSVASLCGLHYGYLAGTHAGPDEPGWNTPYEVAPHALEAALSTMVAATSIRTNESMTAGVTFTGPEEFEVGGLRFTTSEGSIGASDRILVLKDRAFVENYASTLPALGARRCFEFGIYQGGSALFLAKLLALERFVGIDLSEPVPAFIDAVARAGLETVISAYFQTPQDDADLIRDIIEREFGANGPDLIIDDASHEYARSKQSFQIAFPYLEDGGTYIIEDWSWAHWPENQTDTHGWSHKPALTNLVLELVMLLPSSDMIESITVRQGYVMVRKAVSRHRRPMLNIDATLRTRGRPVVQI